MCNKEQGHCGTVVLFVAFVAVSCWRRKSAVRYKHSAVEGRNRKVPVVEMK